MKELKIYDVVSMRLFGLLYHELEDKERILVCEELENKEE